MGEGLVDSYNGGGAGRLLQWGRGWWILTMGRGWWILTGIAK